MKHFDFKQEYFAKKCDVTRQTISNIILEKHSLQGETISKIALAFPDLNTRWLLTGIGKMLIEKSNSEIVSDPKPINEYRLCKKCEEKELTITTLYEKIEELEIVIKNMKPKRKKTA